MTEAQTDGATRGERSLLQLSQVVTEVYKGKAEGEANSPSLRIPYTQFLPRKTQHTRHKCRNYLYIKLLQVYSLPSKPVTNDGLGRNIAHVYLAWPPRVSP